MQEFVDSLVAQALLPGGVPLWAYYLGAMLVFGGIVVFVFILPIAGITTWVERRVAGPLFKLAPYVVMTGFVAAFVVIPFGGPLIIADLNVGILSLTAVTALVVVGILMAGWASNNKWSLLGGIRSAAQIVSYEIPARLSILPVGMLAGTLSMPGIIRPQGWAPWHWFLFHNPFTFTAFF